MSERKNNSLKRAPCTKPPFTIGDIKKTVPPRCFQRSLLRSFSYVVCDLFLTFTFYYITTNCFNLLPSPYCYLAWPVYWLLQGCLCSRLWVIGHECSHNAFSDYKWVDDSVGLILLSALFIPYFSWKYDHRRHHSNTSSLEHDVSFVPRPKSKIAWYSKFNSAPCRAITMLIAIVLGWPLHMAFNITASPYDRLAFLLDPFCPLYKKHERLQVFISDVILLALTYLLYRIAMAKGLGWLICVYVVPLLIAYGSYIVGTYLQHTHPALPYYDSSEWDWLRGALVTVDRDYGGLVNKVFHHVGDTHVLHHLFPKIPHYHAMEATKAIKPLLGEYYQFDGTPLHKAIWREVRECVYVEPDKEGQGVLWFKKF